MNAAVLFGRAKDSKTRNGPVPAIAMAIARTIFNLGAKIALDWQLAPRAHLAVGYKADWFNGIGLSSLSGINFRADAAAPGGRTAT
ncbi:MAG: hypothetical protein EXR09_10760 [Acetobacteraceae bacterium]|nr:hypothetical protein [Acetobacteraceae bacterium]